jgi:prepilin-type N-terminal cleavage/methylation domain-containing protein
MQNQERRNITSGSVSVPTSSFLAARSSLRNGTTMQCDRRQSVRSGFTLMELLVVITIVGMLTAAMIPVMSAASDARRLREGARLVSTMLASAQSRAISSGRAVGVLFQPMKNNPYACMEMYLVESPPPYSGDDFKYRAAILGNKVIINNGTVNNQGVYGTPTFSGVQMAVDPSKPGNQTLIRPGDLIQFNYRGQKYVLNFGESSPYALSHDTDTNHNPPECIMTLTPTDPSASFPPLTQTGSAGMPFTIFRQPVKTVDPPAQLGEGAAVDWYFSGVDLAPPQPPASATNNTYPNNVVPSKNWNSSYPPPGYAPSMFGACGTITPSSSTPAAPGPAGTANTCGPVVVTYSPAGTLEQIYYSCYLATTGNPSVDRNNAYFYQTRPISGAYFLVGKIEKIPQTGPVQNDLKNLPNYQDSDARWVSVTRQSGLPTTAEVAPLQPAAVVPPGSTVKFPPGGPVPQSISEWAGVINAVMNSRRYASGNQSANGI